ncbi:unnamed protein product [Candidula unifasciata]|uniref:Uncharacterized protein n=1 Tax=Candidula unifasciata TaxID=100452 RepID=A0A8S3ZE34_9EUPU|nr:unnamed protein product [Candidula unifasciata]
MEDFLNHQISEVSRQHQALENECRLLRELLKPCYAEQQVDELLRKAEKARHLKSKAKPDVDGALRLETCLIKNADNKNCTPQTSSCLLNDSPVENKDLDIKNNTCTTVPSHVPSPQIESLSKRSSETQRSQSAKNKPQKSVTAKNNSAAMEKNKESKQENRPHSHKPSSSRPRHIPAHMLAPFKTNNSYSLPKRKNSYLSEYSSSTRAAKTSLSAATKAYKILPEIATRDSKKVTQPSDTCEYPATKNSYPKSSCVREPSSTSLCNNNNTSSVEEDRPTHYPDSNVSAADTKLNESSALDLKASVDRTSEHSSICTKSTERDQSSQSVNEAQTSLPENELQQFTLQKNGSSMKLPHRLMKLVNANRSLKEKLASTKLAKKTSTVLAAQQFIETLCAEDDVSPELRTRVSALTCLRSHHMLMDTLQDLHLCLLSENSSTDVLYRAKRILEYVLAAFAELQERANYLSRVKYRDVAPVADISRQCVEQDMKFWLDTGQKRDFQYGCWEHLQTSRRWSHLKFTEKYLQLNISLVKSALAEWWHVLLENRDLSVFQGVYALLTSHGQFLPALVENPVT